MTRIDRMIASRTIMNELGFSTNADGPLAREFRRKLEADIANGLIRRHVSWAADVDDEERARVLLELDWAVTNGRTVTVKCLDRPWGWNNRRFYVEWKRVPDWIGDRFRELNYRVRKIFDRERNPYSKVKS